MHMSYIVVSNSVQDLTQFITHETIYNAIRLVGIIIAVKTIRMSLLEAENPVLFIE